MTSPALPLRPEQLLADSTWLRALSRGLVRDHFAADDLAQEAWLAALRAEQRGARAEGVAHRTWLTGVLRNVAWKERRAGARRRAREERGARGESLPSTGELVARADMQRALSEAIVALAEPFRTAILLRYMEDLSGAEIARRQGVPEGTVRWRVKRGLELLREALEGRRGSDWLHSCALVAGLVRAPEGAAEAAAAGTSALTLKGAGLLAAGLTLAGGTTAIGAAWIGTASEGGDPVIATTTPVLPPSAGGPTSATEDEGDAARATGVRTALAVPTDARPQFGADERGASGEERPIAIHIGARARFAGGGPPPDFEGMLEIVRAQDGGADMSAELSPQERETILATVQDLLDDPCAPAQGPTGVPIAKHAGLEGLALPLPGGVCRVMLPPILKKELVRLTPDAPARHP
jgi:RNA polymerase sigma-70 factor (ECF subfamily)